MSWGPGRGQSSDTHGSERPTVDRVGTTTSRSESSDSMEGPRRERSPPPGDGGQSEYFPEFFSNSRMALATGRAGRPHLPIHHLSLAMPSMVVVCCCDWPVSRLPAMVVSFVAFHASTSGRKTLAADASPKRSAADVFKIHLPGHSPGLAARRYSDARCGPPLLPVSAISLPSCSETVMLVVLLARTIAVWARVWSPTWTRISYR